MRSLFYIAVFILCAIGTAKENQFLKTGQYWISATGDLHCSNSKASEVAGADFTDKLTQDKALKQIADVTEVEVVQDQPQYEAHLDVWVEGQAQPLHADTNIVLGHADNPMSEEEVWGKFDGLVTPVLGAAKAKALYQALQQFETPGNLKQIFALVAK